MPLDSMGRHPFAGAFAWAFCCSSLGLGPPPVVVGLGVPPVYYQQAPVYQQLSQYQQPQPPPYASTLQAPVYPWPPLYQQPQPYASPPEEAAPVSGTFYGVTLYGADRIHERNGVNRRSEWMLMMPPTSTSQQLEVLCRALPPPATCHYIGHPESGGLPLITVLGYEEEMRDLTITAAQHDAAKASYIELDDKTRKHDVQYPVYAQQAYAAAGNAAYAPGISLPWGLDRIDQRQGLDGHYNIEPGGEGVHIYHMDTGIDTTNPEFQGRAIATVDMTKGMPFGKFFSECRAWDKTCAADRDGHGTHTAGIIGSANYGVAKLVTLHAVKVLDDSGVGSWSWFAGGVDWVLTHLQTPAIMTASLGSPGRIRIVHESIDKAVARGITIVVSAGNENANACESTPAYHESVITVGSTDKNDERSNFSNYGPCTDIYAPGLDITSVGPIHGASDTMSGTSMSAPHVTGAAALIYGKARTASPQSVKMMLLREASPGLVGHASVTASKNKFLYVGPKELPNEGMLQPGTPTEPVGAPQAILPSFVPQGPQPMIPGAAAPLGPQPIIPGSVAPQQTAATFFVPQSTFPNLPVNLPPNAKVFVPMASYR